MRFLLDDSHCVFAAVVITIAACTGDSPTTPPPGDVTLDRATAPAASIVKVDGLNLDACPLRTSEIRVSGRTAPTVLNERREALMRLPLFYDEGTKWAAPPSGPQDVQILCNGEPWARLSGAITITELPPAPGTTAKLVADYQQIAADYKALTKAVAPAPGIQQQVFTALFAGIDEIVTGSGPSSLPVLLAELEATDPDTLALLDAMFAVGDVDEAVSALEARMRDMRASTSIFQGELPSTSSPGGTALKDSLFHYDSTIQLADTELASTLSLYDDFRSFSKDFIGKTSEEFGLASGLLTIVIKSKLAQAISTTLTLLDYVLNKVVVSALPAKLDRIDLTLPKTKLENSETTFAEFWLHASNVPEELKVSDLTSVITTSLGIAASGGTAGGSAALSWINNWDEIKSGYLQTLLGLVDGAFKEYASRPGGTSYDTELFSIIPELKFTALGRTRELYKLWPETSNVVHPLSDQLQWRASHEYWGSAEVFVTPAAQAFGPHGDVSSTPARVQVGELSLVLDRYRLVVLEGESNQFRVKLSNAPAEGLTVFAAVPSGDPEITLESEVSLYFDGSNWDEYQGIIVTAAEDDDEEDGEATITVFTYVAEKLAEASLLAVEADNDRLQFVLDPASIRVPEGGTAEVGVSLSHPPPSQLIAIVAFSSGDRDLEVQSPTLMRFDEENWDSSQTVTIHAEPDEDSEESSTQFLVSANPPATIDDRYITATEDEAGTSLTIRYAHWTDNERSSVQGTIQVELDPDKIPPERRPRADYEFHLHDEGSLTASAETDDGRNFTGTAYLKIYNYPLEPACPCAFGASLGDCYERQSPDDTLLDIEGRILWDCPPDVGCASTFFYMTLPFLDGYTFETTCDFGYFVSYSAELRP